MPFEYQLQQLCERPALPTTALSKTDRRRLAVARLVVGKNNYELAGRIDGELATNPIYLCPKDERQDAGFDVLRLLHNYLASLYSYNETVRVLFNRYAPDGVALSSGDFTPASGSELIADSPDQQSGGGTGHSYYGRKLSFLRGLRTDFQHGGFSCLTFTNVGNLHGFGAYHVEFDRHRFVEDSGLVDPGRFLTHTNSNERRHPLCFIGRFHENTFQSFSADVDDWFDAAPE